MKEVGKGKIIGGVKGVKNNNFIKGNKYDWLEELQSKNKRNN